MGTESPKGNYKDGHLGLRCINAVGLVLGDNYLVESLLDLQVTLNTKDIHLDIQVTLNTKLNGRLK